MTATIIEIRHQHPLGYQYEVSVRSSEYDGRYDIAVPTKNDAQRLVDAVEQLERKGITPSIKRVMRLLNSWR